MKQRLEAFFFADLAESTQTERLTYNLLKVYLGCFLSRKQNIAKMTRTEIRCAHLLCLSSKAARIFFSNSM